MSLAAPVIDGPAAESLAPVYRLPEFIDTDPELWFVLVENNFVARHVTCERVKYASVVVALKARQLTEVRDIVMAQGEACSYAVLKAEMLKRFGESQLARTRRLLEGEHIGDRRPAQFLRHLRGLAGTAIPEDTLRAMWLNSLPPHIRHILVAQQGATLTKLADLADTIVEHTMPLGTAQAHAVAQPPAPVAHAFPNPPTALAVYEERIAALERELAQMRAGRPPHRGHARPQARNRAKSRARSHTPARAESSACWYHTKYGTNAHKCIPPCNHTTNTTPAAAENSSGSRH